MLVFAPQIAAQLNIRTVQATAVLDLLEEGATIPFIARYRKDKTGGLDEVVIQQIQDTAKFLKTLTERKEFIIHTIQEQGKMTDVLLEKLQQADTLAVLEDIYLPYKPKRRTKAQIAREQGLEPLADRMLAQEPADILAEAATFINDAVKDAEAALQGARDIIAETINEEAQVRARLRKLFEETATLQSKVQTDKETEGIKYKDYFDFSEPIHKMPSHRILAVLRGFLEGILRVSITPVEEEALTILEKQWIQGMNPWVEQLKKAIKDAYRRLLQPSLESEFRSLLKQRADEDAIQVFAENLRQLLLGAPLGSKRVLAIDPGYRTGCKLVCLDAQGSLLKTDLMFIHESNRLAQSEAVIRNCVDTYKIEVVAIGDGTAGRETEQFIKSLHLGLPVFMVNEDGASVYSASEIAREEFPDQDVTVRGSVSIGRRLMDPLAELVKIDPKSIGVGQYQHDVNQFRLKEKLDQTVISCVNAVGVNLNTASKHLLAYVSGIGTGLAENIIKYREEKGKFTSRNQLLEVPRLGGKAFEQCAGFLRIREGAQPLDSSAVHPEAYPLVEKMAADMGIAVKELVGNATQIDTIHIKHYLSDQFGELTMKDILSELKKPGLDPRSTLEVFEFAAIYKMEDVQVGMIVPGIVTNITRFGAFVDIGVKQDGLVHVSEIAHQYITDPASVLKLGQKVMVKVVEVDIARKRMSLSIKQAQTPPAVHTGRKTTQPAHPNKKDAGAISDLSMADALQVLKKQFGK